jgi:hypothetical protein
MDIAATPNPTCSKNEDSISEMAQKAENRWLVTRRAGRAISAAYCLRATRRGASRRKRSALVAFRVIGLRYSPRRLIKRAMVDELVGALFRDPNASKGILTTTSDFAPGVLTEPTFGAIMPNRLEPERRWIEGLWSDLACVRSVY